MKLYRFSPIRNKEQLIEAIKYIAKQNTRLCKKIICRVLPVSLDFMFAFGTPPTAIAHGTKFVNSRDIAKAGFVVSIIGMFLLALIGILW